MFKSQSDRVAVLGICLGEPGVTGRAGSLDLCNVRSGRTAIDAMRTRNFDLVLIGLRVPDIGAWDLIRRFRTRWAWQKWALVATGTVTEQQQITARMFGSAKTFDGMPSSDAVVNLVKHLRETATRAVLDETFNTSSNRSMPDF